ncbi:hypothetical protein M9H77_10110 [Catharanthus roseus]|uniref:Uncharacterized protein n=1 Tax=Catharanthus roseus TaxID=4058 RepID=A0ACC0C2I5_CATRO|nr:hypothetical protein M9H77_10110 [Catharanthus roseus]
MAQTSTVLFLSATTTAVPAKIPDFTLRIAFNFLRRFPILLSAECRTVSAKRLRSNIRAIPPQKYVYPDPNPEFAVAETQKFRGELKEKLLKEKGTFGDELDAVVNVCTEIFSEFLHKDYGGPGTLLVEPFTDMMIALKEKKLPGAPLAAREALLWAQNYVDRDWEMWTSEIEK